MLRDIPAPLVRSRSTHRLLVLLDVATATLISLPARANLGDGIEIGAGRLKLGVDLNERYDDAAGAGVAGASQNEGDFITLIQGKFLLNVRSDNLYVNFGGGVGWNEYAIYNKLSFLSANAKGEIDINRDRPVGAEITEFLLRSDQTTNPVFGLGVLALLDQTKGRLHFRPGGGAIELGVSAELDAGAYNTMLPVSQSTSCANDPACIAQDIQDFNSLAGKFTIDGSWRFLPKTGLMFEISYATWSYTATNNINIGSVPAQPLIANLGFGTLLTSRLSFTIKAGYEGIFFSKSIAPMVNTFDGQAELAYHFTTAVYARAGVSRLFTPVASTYYDYGDNRIYLDGTVKATSFLTFNLTGTVDFIEFGGTIPGTDSTRSDRGYGVNLNGDWGATNWLHVVAGILFAARESNLAGSTYTYDRFIANVGVQTFF